MIPTPNFHNPRLYWLILISLVCTISISLNIHLLNKLINSSSVHKSKHITHTDLQEYKFEIIDVNKEFDWREALANKLHAKIEQRVAEGRIDVLTDTMAIEVEKVAKWHEGIGQALHYAEETHKQGALALITLDPKDITKINLIKKICDKINIKVILLKKKD